MPVTDYPWLWSHVASSPGNCEMTEFCFVIHEIIIKLNIPGQTMLLKKVQSLNLFREKLKFSPELPTCMLNETDKTLKMFDA